MDLDHRKRRPVEVQIPTNRIKEQRELSRLTQEELAKLMDLDFTTVSRHESSARALSQEDIFKYARIFKIQSYELFLVPTELEQPAVNQ